ncbi:MAG: hypothetical protein EOP77_05785 [Variovorax sp.]|nr:MAG: hypothetical protein EOP77_05785 [Variovorax sp.]
MKNLLVLVAIAAALTACSKKEEAPAAAPATPAAVAPAATTTPATPAPAEAPAAAMAPAAPATAPTAPTASADVPKECNDYLDKVSACVSKQSGAAADAMKQSMDQTRASWAAMGANKDQLAAACKAASDSFSAQATAMKC